MAVEIAKRHVIIGNGASGTYAAETIRKNIPDADVTLIGDEPYPLYNRVALPPFLRDEAKKEKVFLRTPEQHEQRGVKLLLGTRATKIDVGGQVVYTGDGKELPYDRLLVATGGRPHPIPAPGAEGAVGVFNFQYWDDAVAIRERMETAKCAVVVGGSYIAYELAEAFIHHGLATTWLIRGPRFLRRVLDEDGGKLVDQIARDSGVDVQYGHEVREVHQKDGQVTGVTTIDGRHIAADLLGVGLGVKMNVEVVKDTPIQVQDGIITNEFLETKVPGVYAAGDVAQFFDTAIGQLNQMGTWNNSVSHGRIAGSNMSGDHKLYHDVPMYSTGLFTSRIRVMGLTPEQLSGLESWSRVDWENRNYQRLFFREGRLVGGCLIGDIKPQTRIIQLIQARQAIPESERPAIVGA